MIFSKLLDCIFPKKCLTCKELVSENDCLCIKCWVKLEFISTIFCPKCCLPYQSGLNYNTSNICKCILEKHVYKKVHSIVKYNNMAKQLVLGLKEGKDFCIAKMFGKLVEDRYGKILEKFDFICPVPLAKNKIMMREFNQCALILKHISCIKHNVRLDLLEKIKNTNSQSGLSQASRRVNLQNAFAVKSKYLINNAIKGKRVAVFDDIVTTGSTANECSKALLKAGALEVQIFSFARA